MQPAVENMSSSAQADARYFLHHTHVRDAAARPQGLSVYCFSTVSRDQVMPNADWKLSRAKERQLEVSVRLTADEKVGRKVKNTRRTSVRSDVMFLLATRHGGGIFKGFPQCASENFQTHENFLNTDSCLDSPNKTFHQL